VETDIENIRGLNLAAVKLTTVQLTKLPLWHKIDMIYFAKSGLTKDLCIVQKKEFSITSYMCDKYAGREEKHIHKRHTHPLVREDVT
jgi:hypothetical protein